MSELTAVTVNGRPMFGRMAKVTKVTLGFEDHGVLTLWLFLDYGGSGQGFGGYALDEWHQPWDRRRGSAFGTDYILRVLEAFGVGSLDKIEGRYCLALQEDDRWSSTVVGIAPMPMDKGKPFLVSELREEWGLSAE